MGSEKSQALSQVPLGRVRSVCTGRGQADPSPGRWGVNKHTGAPRVGGPGWCCPRFPPATTLLPPGQPSRPISGPHPPRPGTQGLPVAFSARLRQWEQRPERQQSNQVPHTHQNLHPSASGLSTGLNYSQAPPPWCAEQRRNWGLDLSPRAGPILIHRHTLGGLGRGETWVPQSKLAAVQGSTSNSGSPDGPRHCLSSFSPLPICSARLCQAPGLGKEEQV